MESKAGSRTFTDRNYLIRHSHLLGHMMPPGHVIRGQLDQCRKKTRIFVDKELMVYGQKNLSNENNEISPFTMCVSVYVCECESVCVCLRT